MPNDETPITTAVALWQQRSWRWLGLIIVVLTTFILVRDAVLNVFYSIGDMIDGGWLASITWHNRWRLPGPPAFPWRYFSNHISPILWLTNAVSFVVPLAKFDYYAVCIAAIHAQYAAGFYRAWLLTEARLNATRTVVAIVVALAATFSGVAIIALGLPHPEMAIPALMLWFVIAVAKRNYIWAACWLTACLMVREDAGFHVFALLALWIGVLAWRCRGFTRDTRWLAGFAGVALGYSLLIFFASRQLFPAFAVVTRSYLGDPPFHHVTVPFVLDRLHYYLLELTYVTLPLPITVIWSAISRNPLIPLGYIAALPWLVLNFFSVQETAGILAYYYAFPFWLSLAWPLVALRVWEDAVGTRSSGRLNQRWPYALLLTVSLIGWHWNGFVIYPLEKNRFDESPFLYNDTLRERARYQIFVDYFLANRPLFGPTALDQAVFALLIDHADRTTWFESWPPEKPPPETMIYFTGAFEYRSRVLPLLRTGVYSCVYSVPGTHILLATQNPLASRLPPPMPFIIVPGSLGTRC